MAKDRKRKDNLIRGLVLAIAVVLIFTVKFEKSVLGETNNNSNDFAVVVKENSLWLVKLSNPSSEVIIDKGGVFKNPRISPDGQNVAYTKDNAVYISHIDLTLGKNESIKVSEKIVSYAWADNKNLVYSTDAGGLNGFDINSKKSSMYIESKNHYEGLVGDGKGVIYGEVYRYYTKNEMQYIEPKGVISYELALKKEKLAVPAKPINEVGQDMGLLPKVAGISKDGAIVYIWCKVNSASINADGVGLGVYEVKGGKFTAFNKDKIFALAYKDNLAINPVDSKLPVLNNGGVRNMNINKTLGEVNVTSGTFRYILPENMIATDGPYGIAAKGMVTMTPAFSPDGKKVIFSASKADENMQQWEKKPHNIYTVDMATKKVEKITKDTTFDFAPNYISNGKVTVFVRRNDENYISLWRLQENKEECVSKGIKLDEYSWYYGHINLENSLDIYISQG